jgi:hypothetical protein
MVHFRLSRKSRQGLTVLVLPRFTGSVGYFGNSQTASIRDLSEDWLFSSWDRSPARCMQSLD